MTRPVSRLWTLIPLAVLAALVGLFAISSLRRQPNISPDALVGRPLPGITLPTLVGGEAVPLRSAVEGPTLVNVFASWCTPCEVEHPELVKLSQSGVRVVGLAYKDDPAKTTAFLDRLGDPFATVLVDRDGRAGIELGITGVPETYLVDGAGVVRAKHAGPLTPEHAGTLLAQARSLP
ncbi:MAG: DsbE family thiol:disulfide interchange protein [Proteobacteria bacterium]|nr:DsbE family thiol:disulfide interchange protein [Pseudomonadota bacterium]